MRECKITVLSLRCFLTSSRSCASIDIPVYSNRLTRLWAITREHPNIFAARIPLGTAATCQKPFYAHFDVHVALLQDTSLTFFVDFRCSDSKDSRLMCLSPSVEIFLLTVPRRCFFCGFFLLVMLHVGVCCNVVSVLCSLVVTCWERAGLLAVVCVVFCHFHKMRSDPH